MKNMRTQKSNAEAPVTTLTILDEMVEVEQEFQKKREEKRSELEAARQELMSKLRKVDAYLGTDSFGAKSGKPERGARLRKGELEKWIKDALAEGPAAIGELIKRVREAGLDGKDASIRSKLGSAKWYRANGIVKDGTAYRLKK